MIIALWITAVLLAALYLLAGSMKVAQPKERLQPQMAWVEDFAESRLKVIGALEVLGALGVILPLATGILPAVTGVAAIGLVAVQVGAIVTHLRRKETQALPINGGLLLLALAVAILRFATL